jgi:hypothetical protein
LKESNGSFLEIDEQVGENRILEIEGTYIGGKYTNSEDLWIKLNDSLPTYFNITITNFTLSVFE